MGLTIRSVLEIKYVQMMVRLCLYVIVCTLDDDD